MSGGWGWQHSHREDVHCLQVDHCHAVAVADNLPHNLVDLTCRESSTGEGGGVVSHSQLLFPSLFLNGDVDQLRHQIKIEGRKQSAT